MKFHAFSTMSAVCIQCIYILVQMLSVHQYSHTCIVRTEMKYESVQLEFSGASHLSQLQVQRFLLHCTSNIQMVLLLQGAAVLCHCWLPQQSVAGGFGCRTCVLGVMLSSD